MLTCFLTARAYTHDTCTFVKYLLVVKIQDMQGSVQEGKVWGGGEEERGKFDCGYQSAVRVNLVKK